MTEPMPVAGTGVAHAIGRCGALTRSGAPCTQFPVGGANRCRMHNGNTAKAAERRLAARVQGQLEQTGWDPIVDPLGKFADLAGEIWMFKELCRVQVNELHRWDYTDLKQAEDTKALVQVYERALDRAAKTLVDMMRLGLDAAALGQAKARPSREQAEALLAVLGDVLDGLELSDSQRSLVPAALTAAFQARGLA